MKKLIGLSLIAVMTAMLAGCDDIQPSADEIQKAQQEKIMQEGTRQTGMPTIKDFKERKELKTILEERDKANLITYMYTQAMDGRWVFQGKAIGFPIPYSTEYTNPSYIADRMSQGGYAVLPQADPNGLFSSQNTQADWIMRIDPVTNEAHPAFCEPNIYVTESKIPAYLCEPWSLPNGY